MNVKELKKQALRLIDLHPTKADEIRDLFQLAMDEIEQGGSEWNECMHAYSDMLECVKEK